MLRGPSDLLRIIDIFLRMPRRNGRNSSAVEDLETIHDLRRLFEAPSPPPPPAYSVEPPPKPSRLREIRQFICALYILIADTSKEVGKFLIEITVLLMVVIEVVANTIANFLDNRFLDQPTAYTGRHRRPPTPQAAAERERRLRQVAFGNGQCRHL